LAVDKVIAKNNQAYFLGPPCISLPLNLMFSAHRNNVGYTLWSKQNETIW